MTRVLIISNKADITCDFIVKKLIERNIDFYRFNTEELTYTVSLSLDFQNDEFFLVDNKIKKIIDLKSITAVYYRRPEIPNYTDKNLNTGETEFIRNEILYTLEGLYKLLKNAYWVSPLYSIREAENKIYQLKLAKELGFTIPDSIITNKPNVADEFYNRHSKECIIKPIKSGLIEDKINPKVVFTSKLDNPNFSCVENCPTFLQYHIRKKADIRVTVVGNVAFAALIDSQNFKDSKIDWRRGCIPLSHTKINLPTHIEEKCIQLLKTLNLKFGAIDFILDKDNEYVFLEINPNGQWGWIEKQLDYDISGEIVTLLKNENF